MWPAVWQRIIHSRLNVAVTAAARDPRMREPLDTFVDRAFERLLVESPETAGELGLPTLAGEPLAAWPLTDLSTQGEERRAERIASTLREIEAHRGEADADALTVRVFEFFLRYGLFGALVGTEGARFQRSAYPVVQGWGAHSHHAIYLANGFPVTSALEAESYPARVAELALQMEQLGERLRSCEKAGTLLPRFLIPAVLEEVRGFVAPAPSRNVLFTSYAERLTHVRELGEGEPRRLLERLERELRDRVYPAYVALSDRLQDQLGRASDVAGVWRLRDGDAYYAFLLRASTTTELDADAIHALGLREIARVREELERGFAALRVPGDDFARRCAWLDEAPAFRPPTDLTALLESIRAVVADVEPHLDRIFHLRPRAPVHVEPTPEFAEAHRTHTYHPPAKGGARPGIFEVNLRAAGQESRLRHVTLAYHEALPGHHLQLALVQELEGLLDFRRTITFDAYIEGWAKYAEQIPVEHGLNDDPYWALARLRSELVSTTNLALDTGIHARRWSREQGIRFFVEQTGGPHEFASSVVDRVCATPAQTTAYKLGMLKVLELRDRMKGALGSRYDVRGFHDAVLRHGSLPLYLLEEVVDAEIESLSCAPTS